MKKLQTLGLLILLALSVGCSNSHSVNRPHQGKVTIQNIQREDRSETPALVLELPNIDEYEYQYEHYILEETEIDEGLDMNVITERAPMVALTFDDGPARFTEDILELLENYGGRATFFVLGYRVDPRRNTILRAFNGGSEIAGHTWSHQNLTQLGERAITTEIQNTSATIEAVIGTSPRMFRPPFGQINDRVINVSSELGYSIINWTLDTRDWQNRNANIIYETITSRVTDGDIILLHDIHATTAEAMVRVIPWLIEEGYQLVTVSELLEYLYGELVPGMVYGKLNP